MADVSDEVQRGTAKPRVALVLRIVRGETSVAEAAGKHGRTVAEIEDWQERFAAGAENARRARPKDEDACTDEQIKTRKQEVGELVLDLDILREAAKGRLSDATTSGECGRPCRTAPTFGDRRLWALRRVGAGLPINRNAVYRVVRRHGGAVPQGTTPPRMRRRRARAARSNERWARDVPHIDCGPDGWAPWAAVSDCHDRAGGGSAFARRGRAEEAERAREAAGIARCGTLRPDGPTPLWRSDNGVGVRSRRVRTACKDYRLRQEFLPPYPPEQTGMIARVFRRLTEERVRPHRFANLKAGRRAVRRWIDWGHHRAAPPGPRLPRPGAVAGSTASTRGSTAGEHYTSLMHRVS